MNYEEINEKLKILNTEDYIWLIYIGIIFMSWYSNSLERKYFTKNDIESKTKYQKIMRFDLSRCFSAKHYISENSVQNIRRADNPQRLRIIGSKVFFYL